MMQVNHTMTQLMTEHRLLKAALAQILAPRYPDAEHELARVREIARSALKGSK